MMDILIACAIDMAYTTLPLNLSIHKLHNNIHASFYKQNVQVHTALIRLVTAAMKVSKLLSSAIF